MRLFVLNVFSTISGEGLHYWLLSLPKTMRMCLFVFISEDDQQWTLFFEI